MSHLSVQVLNHQIYWSGWQITLMLSESSFVSKYQQQDKCCTIQKLFLSFSSSIISMHFIVGSPVITIIMLNRGIYQVFSKRFVTHQKVKCVYNASILYKVFTICYLIIHWFNCEELWGSFLPLQSFRDVMWNSVQSLKSLIFISETQETMHLTQSWIIEEEIDTSLCCSRVVKSQCSTVVSVRGWRDFCNIFT